MNSNIFNVIDFGAINNGQELCTEAFAKAVDACSSAGGGTVYCPPGEYCLDMLPLKSNVELRLENNCRLISKLEPIAQTNRHCKEMTSNHERFLIGGRKLRNVTITGNGVIDGSGYENFWNIEPDRKYRMYIDRYWPKLHRPKGLIHFRECENIRIEGITIVEPPAYCVWLLGCDRVKITGIKIDTDLLGPNTDGLDIDCCSNVNIFDCDISAGDDAIAIKSDIHELGYDKACENITVSNCRVRTTSCGIRLGYEGDGPIRKCVFSNIVIYESLIGISLMVTLCPHNQRGLIVKHGTPIYDIIFSDMIIDAIQTFNFQQIKEESGKQTGFIDNVKFHNIIARAKRGSYMGGHQDNYIKSLEFVNVSMTLSGEMGKDMLEQVPNPYPLWNDLEYSGIPWAFYARYIDRLTILNLELCWENASGYWQETLKTDSVNKMETQIIRTFNCPATTNELNRKLSRQ